MEVEVGLLADLQRVQPSLSLLQRGAAKVEVVTQLRQLHHEIGLLRRNLKKFKIQRNSKNNLNFYNIVTLNIHPLVI